MTTPTPEQEVSPVELARMLEQSIQRIDKLFSFKRRINHIVMVLGVGICIDIAITVTFILFFNILHQAQINACRIGNTARHDQVQLWDAILTKFSDKNVSAAQRKKDQDFLKFVHTTFHQINCVKVYHP